MAQRFLLPIRILVAASLLVIFFFLSFGVTHLIGNKFPPYDAEVLKEKETLTFLQDTFWTNLPVYGETASLPLRNEVLI